MPSGTNWLPLPAFALPMISLNSISLFQFKNHTAAHFLFHKRITGICGRNGTGKTNLLDAIYLCCFTKSYFGRSDSQLVTTGKAGFRLEAHFSRNGVDEKMVCILRENGKKEFSVNDTAYSRLADHVGLLPCVIIVPDDIDMITGGSEGRRRFIDGLLSQIDREYLRNLMRYNKLIQQRNALLKQMASSQGANSSLLEVYDQQLLQPGQYIYEKRRDYMDKMIPLIIAYYAEIAAGAELAGARYESQLHHAGLSNLLLKNREKDRILQRTSVGIQRDDLLFELEDEPFKNRASQGQRKSLLFACKLAAFTLLEMHNGFPPLLLLDDVFEKLDAGRMHQLLQRVCLNNTGQVFITDTHCDRMSDQLTRLNADFQLLQIE